MKIAKRRQKKKLEDGEKKRIEVCQNYLKKKKSLVFFFFEVNIYRLQQNIYSFF